MCDGHVRETSIALTPVGDGRFEVYIDDEKMYDRLEAGAKDFYPSLAGLRELRSDLHRKLEVPARA